MNKIDNKGVNTGFCGIIFPGQGSQRLGMGTDFYDNFYQAREVFDKAEEVLPFSIKDIINNDASRLDRTQYTQPCILTVEIAMLNVLKEYCDFYPRYFAGHSLGEYTALVAAGVIPFEAALSIVHQRGQLMQDVTPLGFGAMAAVIMDDLPVYKIAEIAANEDIDVANDNSKNQIVISGEQLKLNQVCKKLESLFQNQGIRVVPLSVSAPFHSRHMAKIEEPFRNILKTYQKDLDPKNLPQVISNFTGRFYDGTIDGLIDNLTSQLSGRVKWQDNMLAIKEKTAEVFELGPHRPLSAFFKTIDVPITPIINLRSAKKHFKELEAITQAYQTKNIKEGTSHVSTQ